MISGFRGAERAGSQAVVAATLLLWVIVCIAVDSVMIPAMVMQNLSATASVGCGIVIVSLHCAWLTLIYLFTSTLFRIFKYTDNEGQTAEVSHTIRFGDVSVAVLLCVRDDWLDETALACLQSMSGTDHLFICDDSESKSERDNIDQFASNYLDTISVIRRETLKGYKAGNLNNWLFNWSDKYAYFFIVDHDNCVHPEVLTRALHYFNVYGNLAFVQYAHRAAISSNSPFEAELMTTTNVTWWLQSLRAKYGLPISFGHSVMFCTESVRQAGGFPDIITEDLAITLRLLRYGLVGCYETSLICHETVPSDYSRFRSRYVRWCVGTVESWYTHFIRLSPLKILTPYHVDGILQASILLYPIPVIAMLLAWIIMPDNLMYNDGTIKMVAELTAVAAMLLPSSVIMAEDTNARRGLQTAIAHSSVYISLVISVACSLLAMMIYRRQEFENSGNRFRTGTSKRLFSACGAGTTMTEILVLLVISINIDKIGPIAVPFVLAIAGGLVFRIFPWNSPVCMLLKYTIFASMIIVSGVILVKYVI